MDELSAVFDDPLPNSGRKRKSLPAPVLSSVKRRVGRPPKVSICSSDDGIGSSLDPLNESIAQSVKRRKRVTNSRQFDSKYFLDSVVDQIEHKYRNKGKDDAIIDLQNLEIIDKKGFVEQRVRTEFGYFAENTLEDLRQNSFRNKDLISCPPIPLTATTNVQKQLNKREQLVAKTYADRQKTSQPSTSRTVQMRNSAKLSVQPIKKSMTDIMIASDDESDEELIVDNPSEVSDEESDSSNKSEELDESHPLMEYENRNLWTDKEYQIVCFKKTIEILKNDKNDRFKAALKSRAQQTIDLPALPSGSNVFPIIIFNIKGEPNFAFHFLPKESPLSVSKMLHIDEEIIFLSKTIYEWISLSPKPNNCQKRLLYNRRQLKFNN